MARSFRSNFVSVQYLGNELLEFDQILYIDTYKIQTWIVCHLSTEIRPWKSADCTMDFESRIHLYRTCTTTKISAVARYHAMLAALLFVFCSYE